MRSQAAFGGDGDVAAMAAVSAIATRCAVGDGIAIEVVKVVRTTRTIAAIASRLAAMGLHINLAMRHHGCIHCDVATVARIAAVSARSGGVVRASPTCTNAATAAIARIQANAARHRLQIQLFIGYAPSAGNRCVDDDIATVAAIAARTTITTITTITTVATVATVATATRCHRDVADRSQAAIEQHRAAMAAIASHAADARGLVAATEPARAA